MKNLLLIITTLLLVTAMACTKTKQRIFHNKDWKNIQGTWDIEQVLIDGKDSTVNYISGCYRKYNISYQTGREKDGTLHLFSTSNDFGTLNVEKYKYKSFTINKFNLNIDDRDLLFFAFCKNPLAYKNLQWDINLLNESQLHISLVEENISYKVKYRKI